MSRLVKVILYIFGSIALLLVIAAPTFVSMKRSAMSKDTFTQFREPTEISFIPLKWVSSSIGDDVIEKTAFFIPVQVSGLKGNLFMQFDSGATSTSLYGKTLCQVIDPTNPIKKKYDKDSVQYVEDFRLKVGDVEMKAESIEINPNMGTQNSDSSFVIIGTLGFDSFHDRTLILDFKKDSLAITKKSAEELDYDVIFVEKASVR